MAATIYDIARQAQVSIATVSRVFNGNDCVAEPTRQRVLDAARRLNYRPHVTARTLARQQTNLITAVIPMLTNYFFIEVIRGIQDALHASSYDLTIYSAPSPEESADQIERALQRGTSEATLLFSTPLSDAQARRLKAARRPVALVDTHHPAFDSISVDNLAGGYQATRHLIERGRTRIGMITGHLTSTPSYRRRDGYLKALREAGLPVLPDFVVASDSQEHHGFTDAFGHAAMQCLLANDPPPDAVFAASDIQALGAMRALREAGLRVPDDVAVIGFDDIVISEHVGLSTLRQPMYEMGREAVGMLLRRLADPDLPPVDTVLAATLVPRRTTLG